MILKKAKDFDKNSVKLCTLQNLALGIKLFIIYLFIIIRHGSVYTKIVQILETNHSLPKLIFESTLTRCGTGRVMLTIAY